MRASIPELLQIRNWALGYSGFKCNQNGSTRRIREFRATRQPESSRVRWKLARGHRSKPRRRRDADAISPAVGPQKTPSARSIARLMTTERSRPSKEGARAMAIMEGAVPELIAARDLTDRFHQLIQRRKDTELEPWIADAMPSMMASFASGITRDQAAVQAALQQPWSNGQTEGQNTKLKLVKRQMYGRAKLDLLRARLVGTA